MSPGTVDGEGALKIGAKSLGAVLVVAIGLATTLARGAGSRVAASQGAMVGGRGRILETRCSRAVEGRSRFAQESRGTAAEESDRGRVAPLFDSVPGQHRAHGAPTRRSQRILRDPA